MNTIKNWKDSFDCPNCEREILKESFCCGHYNDGEKIIKSEDIIPAVGMGVTFGIGSDRYAYTIVEVINPRTIAVTPDHSIAYHKTCYTEQQNWDHIRRPDATRTIVTKRKNKRWKAKGTGLHDPGTYFVGHRSTYRDPSF